MPLKNQNKKKLYFTVLIMVGVFLAGCENWTGLASERYDGMEIERDERAIEAYQKRQEIVGESKQLYLPEPFSQEMYRSSLEFQEETEELLEAKTYVVGEDLPPSRYLFSIVDPNQSRGTIRLEDEENQLLVEEYLNAHMGVPTVELDLYEGNQLHVMGEEFLEVYATATGDIPEDLPVTQLLDQMPEEEGRVTLRAGIWEVGKHLEPAQYRIVDLPLKGMLYLFEEGETEPRVIELKGRIMFDEETGEVVPVGPPIELELTTGQKLYVHDASEIYLEKQ